MSGSTHDGLSRREMMKATGGIAVASALAGVAVPSVHAGESHVIRLALVGCGGRGTGAAENALASKNGPTRLVAMVDVFPDRLKSSHRILKEAFADKVDVPEERKFIGFDGYRSAMNCLRPGDIVILATPPAFRWVHFTQAIQKGLNVFMEKPVCVDGPTSRKMIKLGEESVARNLKVGVGLMCRHCPARQELFERIKSGQIGDLILLRAYRQAGTTAKEFSPPYRPGPMSELLYQIQRFHSFLWASGGAYSDFLIHNIDECCWMKDAWPVQARAAGGRHYRGNYVDQNFDSYSVEYTYGDGAKLLLEGRTINGCQQEFASYAQGSKGAATISAKGHTPCHCRIFKAQNFTPKEVAWQYQPEEANPYQVEWDDLLTAVRQDKPYNEVRRGAEASLVTAMGRMAAHTGQLITRDQMLNCEHEFAPDVDKLAMDSPAPLRAGPDGKYPVPAPGIKKKREY
jgi:predicted dehydrogenase